MTYQGFTIDRVVMVDDSFITESTCLKDIPVEVIDSATFNEELTDFIESDEENENKTLNEFFNEEEIDKESQKEFFNYQNKEYKPIEDFFDSSVKEKYLPEEFNVEKIENYKSQEESILFILDKKLSAKNYESVLRRILENISQLLKEKNNCFLFLYSTEVEVFSSHSDVIQYLSEKLDLSSECIKILSMHLNFVEKDAGLNAVLISTAIRKSQKANFLYSFYAIQENTMKSMNDRIWNINNNELLVNYNYLSEGQHIDEILYDIYKSKFQREYETIWKKNYDILVKPIRESIHSYVSTHSMMEYYSIKSRIIKELNNEFQSVSDLRFISQSDDISYGDVIKIDDLLYLVLSQQCDLTVRANGQRINQEIFLLEVEKIENVLNAKSIDEKINKILSQYGLKRNQITPIFEEPEFNHLIGNEDIIEELKNKYTQKKYTVQETVEKNRYELYKYKKNAGAYYINAFILDCLLLQKNSGRPIDVTKDIIESSRTMRFSTKTLLLNGFGEFLQELQTLLGQIHDEEVLGKVMFPKLKCEVLRNGQEVVGVRYKNISRLGRLNVLTASEIHQEYSNHLLRVGKNEAPIL
ncbi:hypothetical protein [Bacillus alkalicellulosilyticus]|uniref:hypothetical protein n=1 Tax=Alkalihalobacterium alkalicellulosilyticum TaxID=1912214 RepID=UPI00099882E1|nr:hypothetical protein [Bacillus alkalicellulosilyticus]